MVWLLLSEIQDFVFCFAKFYSKVRFFLLKVSFFMLDETGKPSSSLCLIFVDFGGITVDCQLGQARLARDRLEDDEVRRGELEKLRADHQALERRYQEAVDQRDRLVADGTRDINQLTAYRNQCDALSLALAQVTTRKEDWNSHVEDSATAK